MKSTVTRVLIIGLWLSTMVCHVRPEPSGLNNIPTTDVAPPKTVVLQTRSRLVRSERPQQLVGVKAGIVEGLELGVDWMAEKHPHAHPAFQAKYAFDIKKDMLRGVLGVANVSEHKAHQGDVFPYAATSCDLKWLRLHLGFTGQHHNEGFFGGIDRTVPFLGRSLQLKADAIQVNDMNDMVYSTGLLFDLRRRDDKDKSPEGSNVLYRLTRNFVLESWVTMPSTGQEDELHLKLSYVIGF